VDQILCPVIEIGSLKQARQNTVLRHTFPAEDEKKPTFLAVGGGGGGGIIQNFGQQRKLIFCSF
jgi:hypothetical protein